MGPVGRILTIVVAVFLIFVVWAILVAPDYDLDDTLLQGKLAVAWFLCAVLALAGPTLEEWFRCLLARGDILPEAFPSILELNGARLC